MTTRGGSDQKLQPLLAIAAAEDPSLNTTAALPLLEVCLRIADELPTADASEIARRCVAECPHGDVSWIVHLARAVCLSREHL